MFKTKQPKQQLKQKSKYEKATSMVNNALSMFHTAVKNIEEANKVLEEDVKDKADEIDILKAQLCDLGVAQEKATDAIAKNTKLSEKLKEFIG